MVVTCPIQYVIKSHKRVPSTATQLLPCWPHCLPILRYLRWYGQLRKCCIHRIVLMSSKNVWINIDLMNTLVGAGIMTVRCGHIIPLVMHSLIFSYVSQTTPPLTYTHPLMYTYQELTMTEKSMLEHDCNDGTIRLKILYQSLVCCSLVCLCILIQRFIWSFIIGLILLPTNRNEYKWVWEGRVMY